jgi:NAD(P)-dependent dehydrogenase (short-subunit alcohol dehydrogenase family)
MDLSGRTALVTGSTSGIGFATAESLLKAGATVVVSGRSEERVAEAVGKLSGNGDVRGIAADIATAQGADDLIGQLPDVDVLVNNMGIYGAQPVFEIDDAEWQRYFDTNVMSGVRLSRHYTPRMVERGWGRVIFVSSESSVFTPTEMVHDEDRAARHLARHGAGREGHRRHGELGAARPDAHARRGGVHPRPRG